MILALVASWSLLGALFCAARWLSPGLPALAAVDEESWTLDQDSTVVRNRVHGWEIELGARGRALLSQLGIGDPLAKRAHDLAIADISADEHFGTKAAMAFLGPAIVLAPRLGLAISGAGFSMEGFTLPCAVAAVVGYFAPDIRLRRVARRRRDELSAVVGFVARLARIAVAGGDGVDTAIRRASEFGDSWAHVRLRRTLAEQHGRPAQQALLSLGRSYAAPGAQQLADALIVAQENGSPVLEALAASAQGIHSDRLQIAEAAEARKSVLLSLPVGLMVLGYLIVLVGGFVAQTLELFLR
jgi:tight adherence protein C